MKTAVIIMLGIFSLFIYTGCKCEPDEEETSESSANEENRKTSDSLKAKAWN